MLCALRLVNLCIMPNNTTAVGYAHTGQIAHIGIGNGHDHLGAILSNPPCLVLAPHHEPHDVLQEDQGRAPLGTQLHKVGTYIQRQASM